MDYKKKETLKVVGLSRMPNMCQLFGPPRRINKNMLPTLEDVLMEYLWIRHDAKTDKNTKKEPSVAEVAAILANEVSEIWMRASIPTVTTTRIVQLIRFHHDNYLKIVRYPLSKRNVEYDAKVTRFIKESKSTLFDIAACKCTDLSFCSCDKAKKVPIPERVFLTDQRTVRKMMIGPVDGPSTSTLIQKGLRKARKLDRENKYRIETQTLASSSPYSLSSSAVSHEAADVATCSSLSYDAESNDTEVAMEASSDDSQGECTSQAQLGLSQQRRRLQNIAKASDRYALSDRAVAEITSGVLQDYGIVTLENHSEVIDRHKVRRERLRYRRTVQALRASTSTEVLGIYFDGRKDKTLSHESVDGKFHRRITVEEHISLVQEPGSTYLGHVMPSSGSAAAIKESIVAFIEESHINSDDLMAMGCDGTAVNTGKKGGAIRLLEEHLNRSLQWFVCMLHANELPLRHLFEQLDGVTTGPKSFSGLVGTMLPNCAKMPIAQFQKIECNFPEIGIDDLSADQKYLKDICIAVCSGHCPVSLSHREPGKLVMSRWITLANRILRLYTATENPSDTLKIISEFIMKVYAPMWFLIKSKPSCKDGSKHLWTTIQKSRYLIPELKATVDRVIQRNAYFGHPENILLCMITDERKHIRELGLRRIMKARTSEQRGRGVRVFEVPPLNFEATDYFELIDWQLCAITEPPILKSLSDDDLQRFIHNGTTTAVTFSRFPSHTQAVERCVKAVTEASKAVIGHAARDGFIRARNVARVIMPTFNTKSEYRMHYYAVTDI